MFIASLERSSNPAQAFRRPVRALGAPTRGSWLAVVFLGVAMMLGFVTCRETVLAADFFLEDFEDIDPDFGPYLHDEDTAFSVRTSTLLSSTVAYRVDQDPGSSLDRNYLTTVAADYNGVGENNVDFVFEVTLSIPGEGTSYVGLGEAVPSNLSYFPQNSVYIRISDGQIAPASYLTSGGEQSLEDPTTLSTLGEALARIEKQGNLLFFHLEGINGSEYVWDSSASIDVTDFGFLTAPDAVGSLFVGSGWQDREFDDFRVFQRGDLNGDGQVTAADIEPMVMALSDRAGYQQSFPDMDADKLGDMNRNGLLDLGDLGPFIEKVSASSSGSAAAVPEPSGVLLALLAGALVASRPFRQRGARRTP